MSLAAGTQIGPYLVLSLLGAGGMGEVYRARDPRLNRLVAIKVLSPHLAGDPDALARLQREARILASLSDPRIMTIHDFLEVDGKPYLVTELLEGEPLTALLAKGPQPRKRVLRIAAQIAKGLETAHVKGVIHRDLKPSNVFLTPDGTIKLLDFGLAKELGSNLDPSATASLGLPGETLDGVLLGSAGYMAPEQVRGERADARSDLFAVGVIMLELLTGRQAFRGDSTVDVLHAILRKDPLEGLDLPLDLRPVLERLLEKDPALRFQTARDLGFLLDTLGTPSSVGPQPALAARPSRRLGVGAASLLLLAVLGGIGWKVIHPAPPSGPLTTFRRLTPKASRIISARFSQDGKTVVYSASRDDGLLHLNSYQEGQPFGESPANPGHLLALGDGGDWLFSSDRISFHPGYESSGNLLASSGPGTVPRALAQDVGGADYCHSTHRLALIRHQDLDGKQAFLLESPPGRELLRADRWIMSPRFNPAGDRIAYLDHIWGTGFLGQIVVVDLEGREVWRSKAIKRVATFAWAPSGSGFVYTGATGLRFVICTLDEAGTERVVLSAPTDLVLLDVDPKGRLLVASTTEKECAVLTESQGGWQRVSLPMADVESAPVLSPDSSLVAFNALDPNHGGGPYLLSRKTGSVARLGANQFPEAISPDNKWALIADESSRYMRDPQYSLVPIEGGSTVPVDTRGIGYRLDFPIFLPGTRKILATTAGKGTSEFWILSPDGAPVHVDKLPPEIQSVLPLGSDRLVAYAPKVGFLEARLGSWDWRAMPGFRKELVPLEWDGERGELVLTSLAFITALESFQEGKTGAMPEAMPRWTYQPKDGTLRPAAPFRPPAGTSFANFLMAELSSIPSHSSYILRTSNAHLYLVDGALGPVQP